MAAQGRHSAALENPALGGVTLRQFPLGESQQQLLCGGIGLAAIQGARTAGASRIIAVDPLAPRREAAIRSGATDVLEPQGALKAVLSLTAGGVHVAIECVGDTRVMSEAFDMDRAGVLLPRRRPLHRGRAAGLYRHADPARHHAAA